MKVLFEKEVIEYINLPSIPKKEWNGKDSFKDGVAVLDLFDGNKAYAVCTFDSESDKKPRIKKVFCVETFTAIGNIYVVPSYMDNDTTNADLDSESIKRAEQLAEEAKELENEGTVDENPMERLPEWIFPEINSKQEAEAWLRNFQSRNKQKGRIPTTDENIKLRLFSIYTELQKKQK